MHHAGTTVIALASCLAVSPVMARAGTLTAMFSIPGHADGASPKASLTKFDGKYYGTTAGYGTGGLTNGTVYRIDPKTGAETIVYAFQNKGDGSEPSAGLTVFDGKLYGTTYSGGANGGGVVFSVDSASGTESVVYALPSQAYARSKLTVFHGLLYGTAQYCALSSGGAGAGCIFSVDPVSATGQIVYAFPTSGHDGENPGDLIAHGEFLFGTASEGGHFNAGTLFRFDPASAAFRVEHVFSTGGDGAVPNPGLVEHGGVFYGSTMYGGASNGGSIFAFTPAMRQESVVHSFSGPDGFLPTDGLVAYDGRLFGGTAYGGQAGDTAYHGNGAVYAFDPASNALTVVHAFADNGAEGSSPAGALTAADGLLYGAQYAGGSSGGGLIYALDPASGNLRVVHVFAGFPSSETSGLTKVGGALYGTEVSGGNGFGSIFKVEPKSDAGTTLYSFNGIDDAYPEAALLDVGGTLYGTTQSGGSGNLGTVFSFVPDGHVKTTLFTFPGGKQGGAPIGPLAALNGAIYGTTVSGGQGGRGTVFKIDLTTLQLTTLADFTSDTGYSANGLIAFNGALYGTASQGGVSGYGTIFKVDPSSGAVTALYSFLGGHDGRSPAATLTDIGGLLYGNTDGGRRGRSIVFKFDPNTNTETELHSIGKFAELTALTAKSIDLYFTISDSYDLGLPYGGIFRTNSKKGATTTFPFSAGAIEFPKSPLTLSNGALFGIASTDTPASAGVVFKYVP